MKKDNNYPLIVATALILTLFLAFIDEGNYNFAWINDLGSWIAMLIYTSFFFLILFLIVKVILGRFQTVGNLFLSAIFLVTLGMMIYTGILNN